MTFNKGLRDRAGEEDVVSRLIVRALSEFSGLAPDIELGLADGDLLEVERIPRPEPLDELLAGDVRWVVRQLTGVWRWRETCPQCCCPAPSTRCTWATGR